jgi:hypothetical protein
MSDLSTPVRVVNLGLAGFHEDLQSQGVPSVHVDWRPPAGGDPELIERLVQLQDPRVEAANAATLARLLAARPVWVDVQRALDAIPGLEPHTILHSGPPIAFEAMCDPQQRAVEGAALFEGLIAAPDELRGKLQRREIVLRPNYELGSVGAMTGVISPSMPVVVVEDVTHGNRSWTTFNEGKGNVIWMGAYDAATLERLRWMRDVLGPALRDAVRRSPEGLDVFKLVSEGVQMGDEVHARSAACTLLLGRWLVPLLLQADLPAGTIRRVVEFVSGNNHSFLSLTISACKVAADAAHGVPHATVVTGMSRNGVEFALRLGGAPGWTLAPTAPMDEAIYYSGYGPQDAAGDIGDSAIIETAGLGAMVIGGAPSISSFVGGGMARAREAMLALRGLCVGANPRFAPSAVDFLQAPAGIDARQVLRLGTTPIIDTGVLHKASGVGQIGTGIARAPIEAFRKALRAFPLPPAPEVRP